MAKHFNEYLIDDLFTSALCYCKTENCNLYKDKIFEKMSKNAESLRNITNSLILPSSKFGNHPFGAQFLNEFLMNFNHPVDRDIIWSVPCNIGAENDKWYCRTELSIINALFKISADLSPEYQILYSRNDIHHYHIGKR